MPLPANLSWSAVSLFFICYVLYSNYPYPQHDILPLFPAETHNYLLLARYLAAMSRMSIKVLTPVAALPCFSLAERMVICVLILHTTSSNQTASGWFKGLTLGLSLQPMGSSWSLLSTVFLWDSGKRWDKTLLKYWCLWILGSKFTFSSCFKIVLMNISCVLSFRLSEECFLFD